MSDVITVKEVKNFLKLSDSTIYKLISRGEIPAFRIGDSRRFDMEEFKAMVENAKQGIRDGCKAPSSSQNLYCLPSRGGSK